MDRLYESPHVHKKIRISLKNKILLISSNEEVNDKIFDESLKNIFDGFKLIEMIEIKNNFEFKFSEIERLDIIRNYELSKEIEAIFKIFRYNLIYPKMGRLSYDNFELCFDNKSENEHGQYYNYAEFIFNNFIIEIFFNWIENLLLFDAEMNIFNINNFNLQFGRFLLKTNTTEQFNNFFIQFKNFSNYIQNLSSLENNENKKSSLIMLEFKRLINNHENLRSLIITIYKLIYFYLISLLVDKNLEDIQIYHPYQIIDLYLIIFGFSGSPNIHIFQILSNILNIRINYLDLNEITPNFNTIFPFEKDLNYFTKMIMINIANSSPFHIIIYDSTYVFDSYMESKILNKNINNVFNNEEKKIEIQIKKVTYEIFNLLNLFTKLSTLNENFDAVANDSELLTILKENLIKVKDLIFNFGSDFPNFSLKLDEIISKLQNLNERIICVKLNKLDT